MSAVYVGDIKKLIFGVRKVPPLLGFPSGQARIRMRPDALTKVYVRNESGITAFSVHEDDSGNWIPGGVLAQNITISRK